MPTLQIRNIPEDLYNELVKSAGESRRSLTQEAIILLAYALESKEMEKTRLKNTTLKELMLSDQTPGFNSQKGIEWIREDRDQ